MKWPFSRRKSAADDAIAVMVPAAAMITSKWIEFNSIAKFKDQIALTDRIAPFAMQAFDGMKKEIKELRNAPDAVLMIIVANGIKLSGTHAVEEIARALTPPGGDVAEQRAMLNLL